MMTVEQFTLLNKLDLNEGIQAVPKEQREEYLSILRAIEIKDSGIKMYPREEGPKFLIPLSIFL